MSFDHAVTHVIEREGGYVNDPRDPGGETKYGISKRTFPDLDIAALTIPQARDIYRARYWQPIRGDELPGPVAFVMFDCAVNQGVSRAVRTAQAVVNEAQDGVLGPMTLHALRAVSPAAFVEQYQAERIMHYASLTTWRHYGRGWSRRAFAVAMEATK
jgi:lysozyme family protein